MSPATTYESLLSQKDKEIRSLTDQIATYSARISILQMRLLSALDALDAVNNTHEEEKSSLKREIHHLKRQLHQQKEIAKTTELEREDMRDAVIKLVEKVERSKTYSNWPRSQLRLSSLSELSPVVGTSVSQTNDQGDLILYASSIIQNLCKERDAEKMGHTRTRTTLEARILELEAQLVRRGAELELKTTTSDIRLPSPSTVGRHSNEPVEQDEIISWLDFALARNKVWEDEIKSLSIKLDEARHSSQLKEWYRSNSQRQPRASDTRDIGISTTPTLTNSQHLCSSSDDADQTMLTTLEQDIRDLGQKIDAFSQERNTFKSRLPTTSDIKLRDALVQGQIPDPILQNNNVEKELEILKTSNHNLRSELESIRVQNLLRERELLNEIDSLKTMLLSVQDKTAGVPDLIDVDDGEMSMELATPLMSTNISVEESGDPPTEGLFRPAQMQAPYIDPPSIPLPISPNTPNSDYDVVSNHGSDMMLAGQMSPHALASHLAEVQLLDMELMHPQQLLEMEDNTLDRLADLVDGWRS